MRQLLKNAKIYDGTGSEPYMGDILIEGDRIAKIAPSIDLPAESVMDLKGLSVSSGFIDGHSHNDWFAIKNDPLPYFAPFLRQGITTFITGNCGISEIGFEGECPFRDKLGGGLFSFEDTKGSYGTPEEYFRATDRQMPCNMAVLVGHCSARAAAGGNENRKLTPEEEKTMLDILEKALQQGAAGISLGLMYEPGLYADVEELKKVAELCVKYNKPLTVHPRAESKVSMAYPQLVGRSHLLRAFDELAEIAKGTNLKLQYSHCIFVGRNSLGAKDELMRMMDQMRAEGVDLMFAGGEEKALQPVPAGGAGESHRGAAGLQLPGYPGGLHRPRIREIRGQERARHRQRGGHQRPGRVSEALRAEQFQGPGEHGPLFDAGADFRIRAERALPVYHGRLGRGARGSESRHL